VYKSSKTSIWRSVGGQIAKQEVFLEEWTTSCSERWTRRMQGSRAPLDEV